MITTDRETFQAFGVLGFDPKLPVDLVDAAVEQTLPRYRRDAQQRPTWRLLDGWCYCPAVKAIALWPAVLEMLHELHGRAARAFQTLNFPVGTQQRPHSDTIHFDTEPPALMAGVWVALEDVDMSNGPLVYFPGSHKLPIWSMQDAGAQLCTEDDMSGYKTYEAFIGEQLQLHGITSRVATMAKGEAIVWAANLIHGGGTILDPARSRHSQVTHYYLDGAKSYTSKISGGRKAPTWII